MGAIYIAYFDCDNCGDREEVTKSYNPSDLPESYEVGEEIGALHLDDDYDCLDLCASCAEDTTFCEDCEEYKWSDDCFCCDDDNDRCGDCRDKFHEELRVGAEENEDRKTEFLCVECEFENPLYLSRPPWVL